MGHIIRMQLLIIFFYFLAKRVVAKELTKPKNNMLTFSECKTLCGTKLI